MAFPLPRELNPIEAIKKEIKAIEKARYVHPQFDRDLNRWVVAFIWNDGTIDHPQFKKAKPKWNGEPRWLFAGLAKKPRRWTAKALRKIRRKLKVPKDATMHVTDLWRGADGVPTEPPRRRVFTTAPTTVSPMSLELRDLGPKRKRKVKEQITDRTQAFGKKVRFIALGKMAMTRELHPIYLGPLMATKLGAARKEARQMFRAYRSVWVFDLTKLEGRWRRKIRSGHYRPGRPLDKRMHEEMEAVDPMIELAKLLGGKS